MDAFSLLRYWRSNGSGHDLTNNANQTTSTATATATATATTTTTTIVTAAVNTQTSDTEEDENNDHGLFFDLEFTLPEGEEEEDDDEDEESDGSESELKFTLMSNSSGADSSTGDVKVSVSPSDDLFFKGGFIPVDQTTSESNSKPTESQSRVSLIKSATKLRVMMLKFNKKSNSKQEEKKLSGQIGENQGKLNVDEVPIVSLFKRHNSSKTQQISNQEKKFSKEAMQRYLRKVKPLYVRVSKRYGEKLKFSGQLKQTLTPSSTTEKEKQSPVPAEKESNLEASEAPLLASNAKGLKQGNLPAGLRVVCKHLGKSRSASTAVVAVTPAGSISSKRRDDSLLQQQDGIQSAILHCKRSFKASRDSDCSSNLSSESVPAYVKSSSSETNDGQKAGN